MLSGRKYNPPNYILYHFICKNNLALTKKSRNKKYTRLPGCSKGGGKYIEQSRHKIRKKNDLSLVVMEMFSIMTAAMPVFLNWHCTVVSQDVNFGRIGGRIYISRLFLCAVYESTTVSKRVLKNKVSQFHYYSKISCCCFK